MNATPMTLGNYNIYRGWELPEDEEPSTEGFMVEYLGSTDSNHKSHSGYISWTPAEQFNNHYDDLSSGISYGHALLLLELGYKLAREGWNGKGMFIVYMSGLKLPSANTEVNGPKVNARTAKYIGNDNELDSQPYFSMYSTATNKWQPGWNPSTPDQLARDWKIVE